MEAIASTSPGCGSEITNPVSLAPCTFFPWNRLPAKSIPLVASAMRACMGSSASNMGTDHAHGPRDGGGYRLPPEMRDSGNSIKSR